MGERLLDKDEAQMAMGIIASELQELDILARAVAEMTLDEEDRHAISRMICRSAKTALSVALKTLDR